MCIRDSPKAPESAPKSSPESAPESTPVPPPPVESTVGLGGYPLDALGDEITERYIRPGHPNDGNEGNEGNEGRAPPPPPTTEASPPVSVETGPDSDTDNRNDGINGSPDMGAWETMKSLPFAMGAPQPAVKLAHCETQHARQFYNTVLWCGSAPS